MADLASLRSSALSGVSVPVVWGVAALLLAAMLAWQGAALYGIWRGEGIDNQRLKLRTVSSRETGMGLEQVAGLHLFGEVSSAPPVTEQPVTMAKTDLKLVLVGAMTNTDPKRASALIGVDQQTRRFFVGDSVTNGVVLQEVHADSVVLKRNGVLETLSFPRVGDVPAVPTVTARGIGAARRSPLDSAPVKALPQGGDRLVRPDGLHPGVIPGGSGIGGRFRPNEPTQ
ncbi:MAG: hypothetical protein IT470_06095 [Pseudomonadales bacterium]|nr:hypothetical protein [Pseudomonadales bacterium]